ncbi:hypothetical protein [Modestobacter sp. DSM 44400]|uniref:hypothetical protein n=1 Tax=Modestobacter sp. DSM 44400 TaxID=1550230 RepID=UPI0011150C2B|nr:hypothetical protein [Modestobacter sp. DSM 44400]
MTEDVDAAVGQPTPAPAADPGRARSGWRALGLTDGVVVACAVLYLVCTALPWFRFEGRELGAGARTLDSTVNGFDSAMLSCAAVVLVLAAVWSVASAWTATRLPFPRVLITTGLAAVSVLLTVPEWLTTVDVGFSLPGLLTVLCATAALAWTARASLTALRSVDDEAAGPPDLAQPAG